MGTHNISSKDILPSRKYLVKKALPHPNFDEFEALNDIGLLFLEEEVVISDSIQAGCLPNYNIRLYPTNVNVDSWIAGLYMFLKN